MPDIGMYLDRAFPLIFAGMAVGLLFGRPSPWIGPVAVVLLAALMTLALAPFGLRGAVRDRRGSALATLAGLAVLSPMFLLVGFLYPSGTWPGWVLLAAAPPAVSVIPYAGVFRSDVPLAVGGTLLSYAAAFVTLPLITWSFLGSAVDLLPLVQATSFLILVPLVLSRGLRRLGPSDALLSRIRNLLFFGVFALVTAAIRDLVFGDPLGVGVVLAGTGAAVAAGAGLWILMTLRRPWSAGTRTTYVLFASYKNQTLAAALALSLIGPVAALPAILAGVFEALWLAVLLRLVPPSRGPGPAS